MFLPLYSENESEYPGKKFRASDYYHFHLILTLRHQKLREAVQISKSRMSIRIMNSEYGKNFAAIIPAANEIIMIHTDPFLECSMIEDMAIKKKIKLQKHYRICGRILQ